MAEEAAARFGLRVETSAESALQDALELAEGRVRYYLAQVAALPPGQLTGGYTQITRRIKPDGQPGAGRLVEDVTVAKSEPHVLLRLLDAAEKHRVAVAKVMAELGIEKRRLDLAQVMGGQLFEAMQLALDRSGLTAEQRETFIGALPAAVASITGELLEPDD
jgi:hypothetical protein